MRIKERIIKLLGGYTEQYTKQLTARALVDIVLERPMQWVDWQSMPLEARKQWGADAKMALENRCLQHIIGKSKTVNKGVAVNGDIVKRCIEAIARHSKDHQETEAIRMTINGAELVRELLEEMLWTEEKLTVEEPNAPL